MLAKYSFSKISIFDTQIMHCFILIFNREVNDRTFFSHTSLIASFLYFSFFFASLTSYTLSCLYVIFSYLEAYLFYTYITILQTFSNIHLQPASKYLFSTYCVRCKRTKIIYSPCLQGGKRPMSKK